MKLFRRSLYTVFLALFLGTAVFIFLPVQGHVPVLMYHFIDTPERAALEKNVVSEESFEKQMHFLKTYGYRVISLDEYYDIRRGVTRARGKEVVITFDDGNYSFIQKALPVLQSYQFPAAVFVVSQNVILGLHGSMTEKDLKTILDSGLITIGSHSRTHPFLSQLNSEELRSEIENSKKEIEEMIGRDVKDFAYPSGDFNQATMKMVQDAGYRMAFTTSAKKLKNIRENLFAVTRIKISKTSDFPFAFWVKLSGIYSGFKSLKERF